MSGEALHAPVLTERFVLEPLGRWRAFRLSYPLTRDAEIMLGSTGSAARRAPWKWFREMVRPNNLTKFVHAIRPHGQDEPIGLHVAQIRPHRTVYLGFLIHDRAWRGKGVVPEVRGRMIDHLLAHAPVDRFCCYIYASNIPSLSNCRKLGFTHVGTLHRVKADPVSGAVHDTLIFELFREEWDTLRKAGHG